MAMYEVVLRLNDTDEVRLHDRALAVGETLRMMGIEWVVTADERPENPHAVRRYVCSPANSKGPGG